MKTCDEKTGMKKLLK